MVTTDRRDADDRELTPAESLALIDSTLRTTRDALAFSEWPYYAIWGLAWGVAFTVTHLARSTVDAPLAQMPDGAVGAVWLVCVGAAIAATGVIVAHGSRGLAGTTARMGRRLGLSWFAAFAAAGPLGALLDLDEHEFGALFVFVVALLYLGQGAAFADDLQLGVGVWLLAVDVVALAVGPAWFNLVLAVFGAGAFGVAAVVARRSPQRVGLADG
jgi:hypothetical protein